jgi:hypothetical protein
MTDTLHYSWDERPAYKPLTREECVIALRIAEYDAERAADLLKINTGRLMRFLLSQSDLYRQVTLRTAWPFISVQDGDAGLTIRIKKDAGYNRVAVDAKSYHDDVVITLYKAAKNARAIATMAQIILDEEDGSEEHE